LKYGFENNEVQECYEYIPETNMAHEIF